jgi:outer membrane protein TolC
VQAAHLRTVAAGIAASYATSLLIPVPGLALVQQRTEPFPNGQHYALGVNLQVPVWNWMSGERARANAASQIAATAESQTRAQAAADIAQALDQFHATEPLARRFDAGLLRTSREALDAARYAYQAGALSYVELLDAIRTHNQIRIDAATAAHDYWVSAFAVARALDQEIVH